MIKAKALLGILLLGTVILHAASPPAWVRGQGSDPAAFPSARYLTGYGCSGPKGTEAERRLEAQAMAREALVSSIRARVTTEFVQRVTQVDQSMQRFVQNWVTTRADLEIPGLDTFQAWQDDSGHVTHVLAVLDKPRTLQILQSQIERQAEECRNLLQPPRSQAEIASLQQARRLREEIEEGFLTLSVLSDGAARLPPCPSRSVIGQELRLAHAAKGGLQDFIALAAMDITEGLPRGIRVLVDRVTYADTPFCGSFSAYVEQILAGELAALGQVKILDRTIGREAMEAASLEGGPAVVPIRAQAVISGICRDLKDRVGLSLRVTAMTGERLATSNPAIPAELVRRAGLQLAPANLQEAQQALTIQTAHVQASKLKVRLTPDRGDGGIYRAGDRLHLFLKANMDCYAKILYRQVDGTQVLIFPNKYHRVDRIRKDEVYQIPTDNSSFELTVEAPFGAESIQVLASTEPIEVPAGAPDANGLSIAGEDLASLLGRTRAIVIQKKAAQYAEDTVVINTVPADTGP